MTVVGLIYIAEMFPARIRGRQQSLILAVGLIGIPLMSWFARLVVPTGPQAWRWVFVLGGMASSRPWRWFDCCRSRSGGWRHTPPAAGIRAGDAARATGPGAHPRGVATGRAAPPVEEPGRLGELFVGRYRSRTLVLAIAWVFGILGFYGFNAWVPTLLVEKGYNVVQSLTYAAILSIGAVPERCSHGRSSTAGNASTRCSASRS